MEVELNRARWEEDDDEGEEGKERNRRDDVDTGY
jgi:hypothetical protein